MKLVNKLTRKLQPGDRVHMADLVDVVRKVDLPQAPGKIATVHVERLMGGTTPVYTHWFAGVNSLQEVEAADAT